jgi:ArsR family transcriptional regulator, arsenate/arsenite/antimonite-responsive transcriptional repressor
MIQRKGYMTSETGSLKNASTKIFGALSDETRLRVLRLLEERELCVCELMQVLDMSQPRISRHLGVLKNAGLVKDRREGKWVYYALPPGAEHDAVKNLLNAVALMGHENGQVQADRERLKRAVRLSELKGPCPKCSR